MKIRIVRIKTKSWSLMFERYWSGRIICIGFWKLHIEFDFRENWWDDMRFGVGNWIDVTKKSKTSKQDGE